MITIDHVSRTFGGAVTALDDVSRGGRGEIFGVIGQSGAGKSTLIRSSICSNVPTAAP